MSTKTSRHSFDLLFAPVVAPSEQANELPRQFSGICYSGGVIPNYGFFGDAAIDLDSLRQPDKARFALVNHDANQRAGRCQLLSDGQAISINGTFLKNATGQQVAGEFSDGAPWEFSVGINATPETFEAPTTLDLNGQTITVDTVFRNASVREVSFVPAGADPNTRAVAFNQETRMSEPNMLELTRALDAEKAVKVELEARVAELMTDLANANHQADQLTDANALLSAKLADSEQALEAVKAELSELRQSIRLSAVQTLFADLDREFSPEAAQPYVALADDVFALLAADLRATKTGKADETLFQEQATTGREVSPESQVLAMATDLRKSQPALTQEQAIARVLMQNPSLYAENRNLGAR